jgi:8-oxo-dGTP diphosphatase
MDRTLKVVAYIVHDGRLAVFTHADDAWPFESGLQVPVGTVRGGELPEAAVLREAYEETGLEGLRVERLLGVNEFDSRPYSDALHIRHYFHLSVDAPQVPERWIAYERGDAYDFPIAPEEDPAAIRFELFWIPLEKAHVVAAGQTALLGRLYD